MELQGKKVLVFGSGKSGIGASDLLAKVGAVPVIFDGNAEIDKEAVVHKTDGTYPVSVYAGELPEEVLDSLDLVVLSPGVPTDLPLVKSFYEKGLPVWGEVELAYRVGDGEVLAITGTNGKTTTTALLGKIMQDARESVFVVGNIGTPYTSKALEMKPNSVTVAEISSFQLETIEKFAPKVSAILNITEDHLNRHHTMEEYIRVKELITKNQGTEDVCVLNYEDEVLRKFGEHLVPRVVYFSSERKLEEGIYLDGNKIKYTGIDTYLCRLKSQWKDNSYSEISYAREVGEISDGMAIYSYVPEGVYDISIEDERGGTGAYASDYFVSAATNEVTFALPVYQQTIVSDNTDFADLSEMGEWKDENGVVQGKGRYLYLAVGNYTLTGTAEKDGVTYQATLQISVTDTTRSATVTAHVVAK